MKKGILFIIACAFLLTGFHSTAVAGKLDAIHVKGKDFVNSKNEVVRFTGVSFSDPAKLNRDGNWNKRFFQEAHDWGCNIVRFPVHPSEWRRMGADAYMDMLDKGVAWAEELGMYVVIDWHSIGNLKDEKFQSRNYDTTLPETTDFWEQIARRYKGNAAVAFYELYNEPTSSNGSLGDLSWTTWKPIMEELIDKVNAIDDQKVFLVAGMDWAYLLDEVLQKPVNRKNVAYVTHPYPQKRNQPWEPQWEKDWGKVAETYPIMATEFGFVAKGDRGEHIPCIGDETYGEAIIKYFNSKGISYTVWVFDPHWAPAMLENYDFEPTRQGRFFKKVLTGELTF